MLKGGDGEPAAVIGNGAFGGAPLANGHIPQQVWWSKDVEYIHSICFIRTKVMFSCGGADNSSRGEAEQGGLPNLFKICQHDWPLKLGNQNDSRVSQNQVTLLSRNFELYFS